MTDYTKPSAIPAWAEAGDRSDVPSNAEIQEGWPLTNTPPTRQRMNWIMNWMANAVRYLMQVGVSEWDAAESYRPGSIVIGPDEQSYQAILSNSNLEPSANPTQWKKWPDTSDIEADVAAAVAAAGAATTTAGGAVTTANAAQTTANAALPKAGGTMTGPIVLAANAAANLQPTPLQQVNSLILAIQRLTGFRNLRGGGSGTGFASYGVSFDLAVVRNLLGETQIIPGVSNLLFGVTANTPGGTDGSTIAGSTHYYGYVIWGVGKTTETVISLSDVNPNLTGPNFAGYTHYAIVTPFRLDGVGSVLGFYLTGDVIQYRGVSANTLSGLILGGVPPNNVEIALNSVAAYVPPKSISWKPYGSLIGGGVASVTAPFGRVNFNYYIKSFTGQTVPALLVYEYYLTQAAGTERRQFASEDIPYFNGQAPYFRSQDALDDPPNFTVSVGEYRYPNGAT